MQLLEWKLRCYLYVCLFWPFFHQPFVPATVFVVSSSLRLFCYLIFNPIDLTFNPYLIKSRHFQPWLECSSRLYFIPDLLIFNTNRMSIDNSTLLCLQLRFLICDCRGPTFSPFLSRNNRCTIRFDIGRAVSFRFAWKSCERDFHEAFQASSDFIPSGFYICAMSAAVVWYRLSSHQQGLTRNCCNAFFISDFTMFQIAIHTYQQVKQ